MPQSLANVLLHIVFSTKHREPFLATRELRGSDGGIPRRNPSKPAVSVADRRAPCRTTFTSSVNYPGPSRLRR